MTPEQFEDFILSRELSKPVYEYMTQHEKQLTGLFYRGLPFPE